MAELKVWHDDDEWVIAESPADAQVVWEEEMGEKPDPTFLPEERWRALPDDKLLKMWIGDPSDVEERTCAEWVKLRGRCYLGGSDY